ncbi:MAG: hypothetical protein U0446_10040 [Dehalococcoidia bacterium]
MDTIDASNSGPGPERTSKRWRKRGNASLPAAALLFLIVVAAVGGIGMALIHSEPARAVGISIIDDGGSNDPNGDGQNDLTRMTGDDPSTSAQFEVSWSWDEPTTIKGGNASNACAMFDTNGDGNVNYSFCVEVSYTAQRGYFITDSGSGADSAADFPAWIQCTDNKNDRCTQPTRLADPYTNPVVAASCSVAETSTDPFGPTNQTAGTPGGAGDDYPSDLSVTCQLSQTLIPASAKFINVCSYPSAGNDGNNNPFDCVVTPGAGFLTIVKVADPSDGTAFTFNASTAGTSGESSWTIHGSGSVSLIPYAPTTSLNLTEAVPSGWNLTGASCVVQPSTATGTPDAPPTQSGPTNKGVQNITIASGLETICTFHDSKASTPTPTPTSTPTTTPTSTPTATPTTTPPPQRPAVQVDKTSVTTTLPTSGGAVTYTFTVTNTGPVAVTITSLEDNRFGTLGGDGDCKFGTVLGVGASCSFDATFNVPAGQALATFVNKFTAVVTDANQQTATDDDDHTITYLATPLPSVLVDKTSVTTTLPTSGGSVTFTYTVTNTGPVAVTIQSLSDDKFGTLTGDGDCKVGTLLGVGASCSFDATFTVPAGAAQTTHVNTFTAVVHDNADHTASDTDDHTITYLATPLPAVLVDKTSTTTTLPTSGGSVTFTYTVTNTGPVAVTIQSLSDDKFGTLAGDGDCKVGTSLAVGASCSFDATFTVPAGAAQTTHVNTFTAVVHDNADHTARDTDDHTITYLATPLPAVLVDKTSVTTTLPTSGGPVTFTYTVTNTGPVAVTIQSLTDDKFGTLIGDGDCKVGTLLAAGASCSFDATFTVPAGAAQTTHVNTFTAVVHDNADHTARDTDDHTITYLATPLPAVLVDKTSVTTTLPTSGGSVTFTYTVTNTGPVPVTIQSLTDDKFGTLSGDGDCKVGTPLAVGASCSFDAAFTVPAGAAQTTHVNTFTAVVHDNADHTASDTDDHTITYLATPLPAVLVDKTSATTTLSTSGGSVTFTFTVTNTGPVPATIQSLTDDKFGPLAGDADCKVGTLLAVGAWCDFSAAFTVPAGAAQTTHVNTFTAVVHDNADHTASDTDDHTITYIAEPQPSVLVDKTSATSTLSTSGGSVTFTYTVTNTGPVAVTIQSLNDDKFGALAGDADCKVGTALAPGASCTFDGTFNVPAGSALSTHINTFTAVVKDSNGKTATDSDDHTITYIADAKPSVRVDKTSATTTLPAGGGSVTYTFTVTNTGPVAVTITSLNDDKFGALAGDADCKVGTPLAVGASCTFDATFAVPGGTVLATFVNTFTAVVTDAKQQTATASDSHTITYIQVPVPAIRVDKTSVTTTLPTSGGPVTFTYTVTNTGPVPVTITSLVDDKFGTLAGDADCKVGILLGVGASCSFDATFTVPAGADLGTHINRFTAVVTDSNQQTATANDTHTITYLADPKPSVRVDKTSVTTTLPVGGGPVKFTYTVTNTGPVSVTITSLSDDKFGTLVGDADCKVGTVLAVGASCAFDATFTVPAGAALGTHVNTFTAVVADPKQQTATGKDSHTITYVANPQPSILVDKTSATTTLPATGGPVTYTYTVTNTGPIAVTITSLSDDKFGTLSGDADCKVGTVLAIGASCTFDATFTVPAGVSLGTHVNTFTAVVTDPNQKTATGSDTHSITYQPVVVTTVLGSPPPVQAPTPTPTQPVPSRLPNTGSGGNFPGSINVPQDRIVSAYEVAKERAQRNVTLPISWLAAGAGLVVALTLVMRSRSKRRKS